MTATSTGRVSLFCLAAAALCTGCSILSAERIKVQSAYLISETELLRAVPPEFMDNQGLHGKVVGVAIRLDGRSVQALAADSRNPFVKYVDCDTGEDVGYSFGPFLDQRYITEYVREKGVDQSANYTIVATAMKRLTTLGSVCIQLESRLPIGIVAMSDRTRVELR